MEVSFYEKGKQKIAAYILTCEEGQDPDIMKKISADLASRGKKGYTVGIVTLSSPRPPAWNEIADSMRRLEGELEWWRKHQERKQHQEETKQKEKKMMSSSYYIFTEVMVSGVWHCINGGVKRLQPIEHPVMVPTLRTDAKLSFAKAYRELQEDGYAITVEELSDNLRTGAANWLNPESSTVFAVDYDKIRQMRVRSGKEHCAFALRSEIADYENGESDDIWDFVSVSEYKRMDDELKKAYQYYEWNDLSGVYRYYEEIGTAVDMQLAGWYSVNRGCTIEDIRIIIFTS